MGRRVSYECKAEDKDYRKKMYDDLFHLFDERGITMAEFSDSSRFLLTSGSGQLYQIGIANNLKDLEGVVLTIENTRQQMPSEVEEVIKKHQFVLSKEIYNI